MELWDEWESIYCDVDNPNAKHDAREFYDEHRAEMDAGAVVLWPDGRRSLHADADARRKRPHGVRARKARFAGESGTCEWPEAYFAEHIWFDEWPADITVRTIALDPSKGRDAGRGDYSAYVHARHRSQRRHLRRGRHGPPADAANGGRWRGDLRPLSAERVRRRGESVSGTALRRVRQRVRPARNQPHDARGDSQHDEQAGANSPAWTVLVATRLRFLANSPSTRMLVDQLRDFPNGAHDDGPDALEMALRLAEDVWHGRSNDDGLGDRLPMDERDMMQDS